MPIYSGKSTQERNAPPSAISVLADELTPASWRVGDQRSSSPSTTSARRVTTRHKRQPSLRVSDLKRAVKALRSVGIFVGCVKIGPDGSIVLTAAADTLAANDNALDSWIAKRAHSA